MVSFLGTHILKSLSKPDMAESKASGAEKLMNPNPDMKVVKLKQPEESGGTRTQTEPWFKPKAGTVFPARESWLRR